MLKFKTCTLITLNEINFKSQHYPRVKILSDTYLEGKKIIKCHKNIFWTVYLVVYLLYFWTLFVRTMWSTIQNSTLWRSVFTEGFEGKVLKKKPEFKTKGIRHNFIKRSRHHSMIISPTSSVQKTSLIQTPRH